MGSNSKRDFMRKILMSLLCLAGLESSLYSIDVARWLLTGEPSGHMGMYYQGMTGGSPTFVDVNASLAYKTSRYRGINVGGSFWATTPLFQSHSGDFSEVKENFVFTELYASFVNPNRISMYAGRFHTDSEWIKHYVQGAEVYYEDIQNLKVDFIWAWKEAYVTDYRMDRYYNPYGSIGAVYLGATLDLPETPLKITPYFYSAPSTFNSFGAKVTIEMYARSVLLYGKMHFLSYISRSNREIGRDFNKGNGGFVWFEGGARWEGLSAGGGVISVAENGATGIDAFGQSSYFERREGLFYSNATTLYGFLEYDIKQYLQLDSAIRHTGIGSKKIFNWEVGITSRPIPNIKFGAKIIGMINTADFTLDNSIFVNDGRNYLLTRVFGQVNF